MRRFFLLCALFLLPGRVAAQQSDTLVQHGDTLTHPGGVLPAITITGQKTERQAPTTATVVPRLAVERALTTSNGPWELLRQAGGLEVHEQGQGPGFASDASIRGFSSDHSTDLALWIDGVPVNEPVNGHAEGYNDWSLLFPQSIAELEVIKGPTSAIFGNFALAGVVNVRTLDAMRGTQAWLTGGSYGQADGAVLTGFDRPGSSGVLGLRLKHEDGWRPNSAWNLGQGYARLVRDLGPGVSVDAGVNLYGAGWNSPGFITAGQFAAGKLQEVANPTDRGFKRRAQERVSLRVLRGSDFVWRSTLYGTQGRWQLFLTTPPEGGETEGSGSQLEEEDSRYGVGFTSAATWILPRSELTLGTQDRFDHAGYQNWFTTDRARDSAQVLVHASQLSGGLFATLSSDLSRHLRLDLAGRYDVLDTRSDPYGVFASPTRSDAHGVFSPKFGLLYHLPKLVSLYGNVSRGFRETDGVITDPTLPLITEWAYETGVKLDAAVANATISLFRMDVSNEQTFNPVTLTSTSGGRSRRQGVELMAHALPSAWLDLNTDWTINDARYRDFVTEDGDTLSGMTVFNTARYVGSASLDAGPPRGVRVRIATNVVGPYTPFDEPGVLLSPYALVHLSAGVPLGRVRVDVGVRNLFDRTYAEVRAGGWVSPGEPRSLSVAATTSF